MNGQQRGCLAQEATANACPDEVVHKNSSGCDTQMQQQHHNGDTKPPNQVAILKIDKKVSDLSNMIIFLELLTLNKAGAGHTLHSYEVVFMGRRAVQVLTCHASVNHTPTKTHTKNSRLDQMCGVSSLGVDMKVWPKTRPKQLTRWSRAMAALRLS